MSRVGTRMAPAPAGGADHSRRTTFAVGRLTWGRSEMRVVEPKRLEARQCRTGAAETVH